MADAEKIQEHLSLSRTYLEAAKVLAKEDLLEPGMFNALHAIELAVKAALFTVIEDDILTHQVAGLFGKHFRDKVGKELCKKVAVMLTRYNIPRYPDEEGIDKDALEDAIALGRKLVDEVVPELVRKAGNGVKR